MTPESEQAISAIKELRTAMHTARRRLYQLPWSLEVQEKIDSLEVSFWTQRQAIYKSLSPARRVTVLRHSA